MFAFHSLQVFQDTYCKDSAVSCIVAIGKSERQVRKISHYGSKQQWRSPDEITLLLLVRATNISVLFFAHIPFVVNRTFDATPTERLQQ